MKFFTLNTFTVLFLLSTTLMQLRAQEESSPLNVSIDLGFNSISSDLDISATTVSSVIGVSYHTSPGFAITLDLGFANCSSERSLQNNESSFVIGNPLLGVQWDVDVLSGLRNERVGVSVGAPLATFPGTIPENRHVEFTYTIANSMRGWTAPYLWLMNVVPLVVEAHGELPISEQLSAQATLSPAFLYSVNRESSQLTFASTLGVSYHTDVVTPRLSWSMFTSTKSIENNNYDQHSIGIGTDIAFGGIIGMVDAHVNIDAPNGLAVDAPKPTWGVIIGVRW